MNAEDPGLDEPVTSEAEPDDLETMVSRMAAIGYAFGPTWSPDGNRLAFISSEAGVPQVWSAGSGGDGLQQVTSFEDQVGGVEWSPRGDVMAVSVAPGGGLNTQIYLVQPGGGEPQRITSGGEVNNWLGSWSEDGRYLTYSSNDQGSVGMDCWLYDHDSVKSRRIAENDGIGTCQLSPDARRVVVWRMVSRGNTNMYLLDLVSGDEHILTPHVGVALANQAEFVDNDTLLISTNIDREMIALARVDIGADGVPGPIMYISGRPDAELSDFELLPDGRVALIWNAAGRSELGFLDLDTNTITEGPGLPAEIVGRHGGIA